MKVLTTLLCPLLFISLPASASMVHSSTIRFKTTDVRLTSIEGIELPVPQVEADKLAPFAPPALGATPQKKLAPLPSAKKNSSTALANFAMLRRFTFPKDRLDAAKILVVEEEAFLNGKLEPVVGARISFIHPSITHRRFATDSRGEFRFPHPHMESVRFFVTAPGHIPAMGYAVMGSTAFVPLFTEKRTSDLVKSLSLAPSGDQTMLLGHALDANGQGLSGFQVSLPGQGPEILYSGSFLGGVPGYFTRGFTHTDHVGGFIVNAVSRQPTDLKLSSRNGDVFNHRFDLSGIPEYFRFISMSFQHFKSVNLGSNVVDAVTYQRPACGITVLAPMQNKAFVPDEEGELWIDSPKQNAVQTFEVRPKCPDYLPTFVSQIAHKFIFPPTLGVFTLPQITNLFAHLHRSWSAEESLVLGHIYPKKENLNLPEIGATRIQIYGSDGRVNEEAQVMYFNEDNVLQAAADQTETDPNHQNFAITGLAAGEYHFFYINDDADGKPEGMGMQVVQVLEGGVTQVDF